MPAMSRLHSHAGDVPTIAPTAPTTTQEVAHHANHAWGHRNAWGASASASPHALSGGGGGGLAWGVNGAPSCSKNHGGSNAPGTSGAPVTSASSNLTAAATPMCSAAAANGRIPAGAKQRVGAECASTSGVSMLTSTSTASLPNSYEQSPGARAMYGGALIGANRGLRASSRPAAMVSKASSTGPLPQQPSQPRASSLPSSPVLLHKLDVQGLEVFPTATGAKIGAPGLAPSQQHTLPQRGASNAASYAQSYVRAQRFMRRAQAFTPPPHLPSHGSAGMPHFR